MEENLNEPLENPNDIKRTNKREKTSWVWKYFKTEIRNGEQVAICNLNIMDTNIPCKKEYKTNGSTKNCIDHLSNKHELFPDGQNNISKVIIYFNSIIYFLKFFIKNFYFFIDEKKN